MNVPDLDLDERTAPAQNGVLRIGIVDDHAIVRRGLNELFSTEPDILVAGEASNGRAAFDLARTMALDVLVLDLAMPGRSGVETLSAIKAQFPALPVLVLSGYPEEQYALNLIRQGASGYLNKETDPVEIVRAVRHLAQGKRYFSATVIALLAQQFDGRREVAAHEALTAREFQVFLKLAAGVSVGEAANALSLSPKTITTHRTQIMRKIGVTTESDLTYYALKQKLLD